MSKMSQSQGIYEFAGFRLEVQERLLLRNGAAVSITPKIFDMLLLFLENPNRLLGKEEIMRTVWPDTHIDEATLTRAVSELRKALGEKAGEVNFVQTVPKRGYRFVALVETTLDTSPAAGMALESDSHPPEPLPVSANAQIARKDLWRLRPRSILAMLFVGLFVGTVAVLAGVWAF